MKLLTRTLLAAFFITSTSLCGAMEDDVNKVVKKNLSKQAVVREKDGQVVIDQVGVGRVPLYRHITIETDNRITAVRDEFGVMCLEINPRTNKPIVIGGKSFESPRNITADTIDIGTFHVDHKQSEEEFIQAIKSLSSIKYIGLS